MLAGENLRAREGARCSAAIKAEGELFCIFLVQVVNPPVFYETGPSKEARLLSRLNIEAQTSQLPARKSDLPNLGGAAAGLRGASERARATDRIMRINLTWGCSAAEQFGPLAAVRNYILIWREKMKGSLEPRPLLAL